MIPFENRVQAFISLGVRLNNLSSEEKQELFSRAKNQNNWFTHASCETAFKGLSALMDKGNLPAWLDNYDFSKEIIPKDVGVLMAGNIPAVGFHDMMCVLLSGHRLSAKLSTVDSVLMNFLIDQLCEIEPRFKNQVQTSEMLKNKDAYIATGSDNSARYFQYYFGKYPSLIRKNRTSVAVLSGEESEAELQALGNDVFTYFGLGCRNVSKIFVPHRQFLNHLYSNWESYSSIGDHHKYHNNYEYNKSIYLVNSDSHLDNGFLLMKEDKELVSPISVLFYEIYDDKNELIKKLESQADKIQCVVGNSLKIDDLVPFGKAQFPGPGDYADGVDTLKFLLSL